MVLASGFADQGDKTQDMLVGGWARYRIPLSLSLSLSNPPSLSRCPARSLARSFSRARSLSLSPSLSLSLSHARSFPVPPQGLDTILDVTSPGPKQWSGGRACA